MLKLNSTERRKQLCLFIIAYFILIILFFKVCFIRYSFPEISNAPQLNNQILEEDNKIALELNQYIQVSDSVNKYLTSYNPASNQVAHESNLNYGLEELRKGFTSHEDDKKFKILHQLDEFYSLQYFDKKGNWNSVRNTEFLKKNLEDCEIGFQQMQNTIQLHEALKSK